jgi:pyruvate-ferredoxin/flavodoxin oxidoreductase
MFFRGWVGGKIDAEDENWEWGRNLPSRGYLFERNTVKGSQFQKPLLEFSGACEGCGETPYVKLLTQLFGERMVVANATGCSSIWGGSAPVNPYTTDAKGRGPAWANSLFEDNAQFGLGIATGIIQRRSALKNYVQAALSSEGGAIPEALSLAMTAWLEDADDAEGSKSTGEEVEKELAELRAASGLSEALEAVYGNRDLLTKPSIWVVGGDGWAYDIGFGGLDHVMSSGIDLNILVLDTEMYSNTGGQRSKSTPLGAVAQFAAGGKRRVKKDLGAMAMAYGDVYTASCCLEADFAQARPAPLF